MKNYKTFLIIALQLFTTSIITAQTAKYDKKGVLVEGFARVLLNNKIGYIDANGKEIAPPIYDAGSDFSEGLALVQQNGKVGYIDKTGKVAIPFTFTKAGNFKEGMALFLSDNKLGFIDKNGKIIVPAKYDYLSDFSNGFAKALLNSKYGYIDKQGKEIVPIKYDDISEFGEEMAVVVLNKKFGFVDKAGKEIIPLKYDNAGLFKDGIALIELNKKFGMIDKLGKELIPAKYDKLESFSTYGVARAKWNGKHGILSNKGIEITQPQFDTLSVFNEGISKAKLNQKDVYVSCTGKIYDSYELLNKEKGIYKVKQNNKTGFINNKGVEIKSPTYDEILKPNKISLLAFKKDSKWGFMDEKATEIIPAQYDEIISNFESPYAKVRLGTQVIYIDRKGNKAEANTRYLYPIKKYEKYGYINNLGEIVIPAEYKNIVPKLIDFADGLIPVTKNGLEWFYINKQNKKAIEKTFLLAEAFNNGTALVEYKAFEKDSTVIIDTKGNTVVKQPEKKTMISNIVNGFIVTKPEIKKQYSSDDWDLIDSNSEVKFSFYNPDTKKSIDFNPAVTEINHFNNEVALCKQNDKWAVTDKTGKIVFYLQDKGFDPSREGYGYSAGNMKLTFSEGLLGVINKEKKLGYINTSGVTVINFGYDGGRPFSEGLAAVAVKGTGGKLKWGYINNKGMWVIQAKYDGVDNFKNGYALIYLDKKYGLIDKKGNITLLPQLPLTSIPSLLQNGIISANESYYNLNGELIYESSGAGDKISNTLKILEQMQKNQ